MGKAILWIVVVLAVIAGVLWLTLNRPDIAYGKLEKKYAAADSKFVDVGGGIRIHYRDAGDPARPLVVLIHGYGDSFLTWEPVIKRLSATHRVIALDLPGHGLTRAPNTFVAKPANYVPVLEAFSAKLNLPRYTVAGNSLGGAVAWQYALAHPERLSGLVLVDAAGWPDETMQKPPLAFRILMSKPGRWYLKHMETRPITGPALQADFHNPKLVTPEFTNRWVEVQRAPGHRDILMSLSLDPAGMATKDKLAKITTPTLVLHGADDHIIAPPAAKKFQDAIPGAELVMYPNAGHLPQWEVPDAVARDIAGFVDRRATAPAAPQ